MRALLGAPVVRMGAAEVALSSTGAPNYTTDVTSNSLSGEGGITSVQKRRIGASNSASLPATGALKGLGIGCLPSDALRCIVLDEADKLLEPAFVTDVIPQSQRNFFK